LAFGSALEVVFGSALEVVFAIILGRLRHQLPKIVNVGYRSRMLHCELWLLLWRGEGMLGNRFIDIGVRVLPKVGLFLNILDLRANRIDSEVQNLGLEVTFLKFLRGENDRIFLFFDVIEVGGEINNFLSESKNLLLFFY
jgi:hypothetical protein